MSREETFYNMETPSLLIEQEILESNLKKMSKLAQKSGISLRPHAKTHKCLEIGKKQIEYGAIGLTLAKTSEAMPFADNGFTDLFLAYPAVGPKKIGRLVELSKKCKISIGVDSEANAVELNRAFESASKKLPILLEVNTGLSRTGAGMDQALEMAAKISQLAHLELKGIYTYRGALLAGISGNVSDFELKQIVDQQGREEAEIMGKLAQQLRNAGFRIDVVSAGSTPTAASVVNAAGLTEIRPGTYVFNDAMQVRLGACSWQECAAKVLVTVVSRPAPDRAIIDAGTKVFAGDSKPDSPPLNLRGCATVTDSAGNPRTDILFERMTEEHGMLKLSGSAAMNLRIGEKLLIVPNHVCTTVNLFDNLTIVSKLDGNAQTLDVENSWKVAARGRVQ